MTGRLFDVAAASRWTGSRALVPIDPAACPACGGMVASVTVAEVPLFRHGGYGAVRETTSRLCVAALSRSSRCRWGLTVNVTEVNPRQEVA